MFTVIRKRSTHLLLQVRKTDLGFGLVARRRIAQGASIGRIDGDVIHDADYGSDYAIGVAEGVGLEPHAPYRYANHSCRPNAEIVVYNEDPRRVYLEAMRPIAKGEAVVIDYQWPADSAIPCRCGAKNCRGWVVAENELVLLQD